MNARPVCDPSGPAGRIVATIGPQGSTARERLEAMLGFGTIRINLAFLGPHNYDEYRELIRRIRERRGDAICVLLDCVGPRVKLGTLPPAGVALAEGAELTITTRDTAATADVLPTVFEELPRFVRPGQPILLAEGRLRLEVLNVESETDVRCRVDRGGTLKKRGLNLPETDLEVPALSSRDRRDLEALLGEDVDMVALSFVRAVEDIRTLREFLDDRGRSEVRIMAKIETRQAVDSIDAIAVSSDALMIARGDLWAELGNPWQLPPVTSRIIRVGNRLGIPVVTATQTLSSMTERDTPSRAEVDELYYLFREGSDAIMGSEEFAVGKYPEQVIHAIRAVSREVDLECREMPLDSIPPRHAPFDREQAAVAWADGTDRVRCIVAISNYGPNALRVHRQRPRKPLVIITNQSSTARYLQLLGVYGVLVDYRWEDQDHHAIARAALGALGWRSSDQTALLIVSHRVSPTREYSKIEEIPLG